MMITKLPPRPLFAALGLSALALLITAYYLQHGPEHQQPCPLCILQRYAYIGIALTGLVAAIHGPSRVGTLIYAGLGTLLSVAGMGLAVWQLTKGSTMLSCTSDPIGIWVNSLPMTNWWPEYFFATGGCADKYPPILGLSVPVWSLICFAGFSTVNEILLVNYLRQQAKT
ncbi:MAG: disulfide bond formation protein B [Betaproteobacteria bacterium]|nr:disulfide bond formation protein B [Betaproteobacteria bacterium]